MTTQSDRGLKNCPWCGEVPFTSVSKERGSVYCGNERCAVRPEVSAYDDGETSGLTQAKALWDERCPVPGTAEVSVDDGMSAYNEGFGNGSSWALRGGTPIGWKDSRTKAALKAQKGVGHE